MAAGVWRAVQDLADSIKALADRVAKLEGRQAPTLAVQDKRKRQRSPEERAEMGARLKAAREAKKAQQAPAP